MKSKKTEITYYPGPAGLPFSEAIRVGNMLLLSGQVGTDAAGNIVKGGIKPETKQTLKNIKATLKSCGASLKDVIEVTVTLADIADWAAMNDVYQTFFKKKYPVRSAFGASGLALGARIEITCRAVLDE